MIAYRVIKRVVEACAWNLLLLQLAMATATDFAVPTETPPAHEMPLGLEAYEPNAFGYTKNNDDVHYENFKVSIEIQLMRQHTNDQNRAYFSFTGVFAFYIGDRESGPVVGQEYNPQFFYKHLWSCNKGDKSTGSGDDERCYFTVGYNHDSNGQIIESPGQFIETARNQSYAAAYDGISRGWDYIGINSKFVIPNQNLGGKVALYPMFKYFLAHGLLQGNPEELHHDWEHPPDAKTRREVDGVSLLTKYQPTIGPLGANLGVGFTTGYEHSLKYNTIRFEAGCNLPILDLPITFWVQNGYMSDLSRYYQRVKGYGVQVEIASF